MIVVRIQHLELPFLTIYILFVTWPKRGKNTQVIPEIKKNVVECVVCIIVFYY